jgi:hypothetical protein
LDRFFRVWLSPLSTGFDTFSIRFNWQITGIQKPRFESFGRWA